MAFNIEIFLCYAREDELLCKELVTHLGALKRQGFFDLWYDREISAGTEYEQEIDKHLNTAQIILLLVSQYFMNSNYCYLIEMQRAIERHEHGDARVIPVLLRPVYFQRAPFAKLMPLPTNKKPITDSIWHSLDEAFFDVAEGIRKAAEEIAVKLSVSQPGTLVQLNPVRRAHPSQAALPSSVVSKPKLVKSKSQQYWPGDKVRHNVFGEGMVLKSEMERGIEFVEVHFLGNIGKKRLSLAFAKLEKL
jgi:hypothetical protein